MLPPECLRHTRNANMSEADLLLGRGAFGKIVWLPLDIGGVAVKQMQVQSHSAREQIIGEMLALDVRHSSLVACIGIAFRMNHARVIMEYGGRCNLSLMPFSDVGRIAVVLSDVASALVYLNALNLVHQDVKAENVLWDEQKARLSDYGCMRPRGTWTLCSGTPAIRPPEVHPKKPHYVSSAIDAWAYGLFMRHVLSFLQKPLAQLWGAVLRDIHVSIELLLIPNPESRGDVKQCANETMRVADVYRCSLCARDTSPYVGYISGYALEFAAHFRFHLSI